MSIIVLFLSFAIRIYLTLIWVYCLLTWIPNASQSKLGRLIAGLVEPYLAFFDRFIPAIGGIGLSPIIGSFVLIFAQRGLAAMLQLFY